VFALNSKQHTANQFLEDKEALVEGGESLTDLAEEERRVLL